ncbi:GNAT family N-acetyltransferase [Rhodococcus sp. WS4]|nr:GNAT family N-acetyltransferase [Rhodococcus sp. WS4]
MRANGLPPVERIELGAGLTGRVVAAIDLLVQEGLAALNGEAAWTSPEWWRFVEADPDHESLYLAIDGADSRPVAVAPALIIRDTRGLLFYNGPRIIGDLSAIGSVSHLAPDEQAALPWLTAGVEAARPALYPSLTVGTFGSNLGLRPFAPGRATLPVSVVVPALARLAEVVAELLGCRSHVLLYLDREEDAALASDAVAAGLRRSVFGGEGVLDVPDGDFDDYLSILPSSRRRTIRREIRAYAEFGARTEVDYGPGALTDDHVRLRSALREKYGHTAGQTWARMEFDTLRDTVGERLVVFSARGTEQVLGYLMAFRFGDVLYTRAAGFDYEASAGAYCYFNVVYYDVIKWAQRNGVRRIHYGLGTTAAKVWRGCTLRPRWAYFGLGPGAAPGAGEMIAIQNATASRLLAGLGAELEEGSTAGAKAE